MLRQIRFILFLTEIRKNGDVWNWFYSKELDMTLGEPLISSEKQNAPLFYQGMFLQGIDNLEPLPYKIYKIIIYTDSEVLKSQEIYERVVHQYLRFGYIIDVIETSTYNKQTQYTRET